VAANLKRVASAVGEGSIAIALVHRVLREAGRHLRSSTMSGV
jgi:hypothetical protein